MPRRGQYSGSGTKSVKTQPCPRDSLRLTCNVTRQDMRTATGTMTASRKMRQSQYSPAVDTMGSTPGSNWGADMCAERSRTAFDSSEWTRADLRKSYFRRSARDVVLGSHRRGHWFDPSIAHSAFFLVRWPVRDLHGQAICHFWEQIGSRYPAIPADLFRRIGCCQWQNRWSHTWRLDQVLLVSRDLFGCA
jgi:hypothetical protein